MAQWNHTDRTLVAKLVYYGPAMGGKTTNLQQIHRITDPAGDTRLISLNTSGDRTLFFDLLPFDLGRLFGYSIKVQLYTVPGQVRYNTTRRLVLSGADGVVFVADSSHGKVSENRAAWENLRTNMRTTGLDPAKVPVIVQYNKQDLPGALRPAQVEEQLRSGIAGIPASALHKQGVIETFHAAIQAILRGLVGEARTGRVDPEALLEQVSCALAPFLPKDKEDAAAQERGRGTTPAGNVTAPKGATAAGRAPGATASAAQTPAQRGLAPAAGVGEAKPASSSGRTITEDAPITPDELLQRSLNANLAIACDYSEMRDVKNRLTARVKELEALHASVRELNQTRDEKRVLERLVTVAAEAHAVSAASVLLDRPGAKTLEELFLVNLPSDPANSVLSAGQTLARRILEEDEPFLARDVQWDLPGGESHPAMAGVGGMAAVPVRSREHPPALLVAYSARDAPLTLGPEELRFLSLLAMQAASAMDNAALYRKMASYSEHLEEEVRRRTMELRETYEKLRELDGMKDRFLSNISHEMKTPLTGILTTAELLESMADPVDERKEFYSIIRQEGRRLADMVEQVIQLWVLRQGGVRPVFDHLDVGQVLDGVLAEAAGGAQEKGVRIRYQPAAPAPLVADRYLLRLALWHLVDNAVKFSPRGGTIEVTIRTVGCSLPEATRETDPRSESNRRSEGTARESGSMILVSVRDEGPGIPESECQRVLEGFEQVGDMLTAKPSGLGLGLPLVRGILLQHGGRLELECPPAGGTIAKVHLPVRLSPPEPAATLREGTEAIGVGE